MDSDEGVTTVRLLPNGDVQFEAPGVNMESSEELLVNGECDSQTEEKSGAVALEYHIDDISINNKSNETGAEQSELKFEIKTELEVQQANTLDIDAQEGVASSTTGQIEEKQEDLAKKDEAGKTKTTENVTAKVKPPLKAMSKETDAEGKHKKMKKETKKTLSAIKGKSTFTCFGDTDAHLYDNPIPEGWSRKAVLRQGGVSAGKYDTYIYSPLGQKFRSRKEVAAYLEQTADTTYNLENFQFTVIRSNQQKAVSQNQVPKVSLPSTTKNTKKIKVKKSGEKAGASNTSKQTPSIKLKSKSRNKIKIKNNIKKKVDSPSAVPRGSAIKDSASSTAILDKLIPSLADSGSLCKSLFTNISFNKNKRKNIHSSSTVSAKRLKVDQNSASNMTLNNNLNVASTSKVGIYPKKMPMFKKQKNKMVLQKKKSYLYGPPNRPLLKKTTPSIKLVLKERNDMQKRKGRPRKDAKDEKKFPVLDPSEEEKLIKDIAKKNLFITLVKCDVDKEVAGEVLPNCEPEVQTTAIVKTEESEKFAEVNADTKPPPSDVTEKPLEKIADIKPESVWIPPQSPYNLIYEKLYSDKWKLLIGTIIMRNSNALVGTSLVWKFLETYPTLEDVKKVDQMELEKFLSAVDSPQKCAKNIAKFAIEYDTQEWLYPCELSGIGKYGNDTYKIFCTNEWRTVKPDEFDLCVYHNWLCQNHVQLHA